MDETSKSDKPAGRPRCTGAWAVLPLLRAPRLCPETSKVPPAANLSLRLIPGKAQKVEEHKLHLTGSPRLAGEAGAAPQASVIRGVCLLQPPQLGGDGGKTPWRPPPALTPRTPGSPLQGAPSPSLPCPLAQGARVAAGQLRTSAHSVARQIGGCVRD